jgi:hypothetical protein
MRGVQAQRPAWQHRLANLKPTVQPAVKFLRWRGGLGMKTCGKPITTAFRSRHDRARRFNQRIRLPTTGSFSYSSSAASQ